MDQQAGTLNAAADAVPVPCVGVGVLLVDRHQRVLLTLRILPPEAGRSSIVALATLAETYRGLPPFIPNNLFRINTGKAPRKR
jgi:hypothetical protein